MKKLLWFTKDQINLLDKIKEHTGENNSEVVRMAMLHYADSLGFTKTGELNFNAKASS